MKEITQVRSNYNHFFLCAQRKVIKMELTLKLNLGVTHLLHMNILLMREQKEANIESTQAIKASDCVNH